MVSQVSTPKATGTPVARVTAASPAAACPATWSKCGPADHRPDGDHGGVAAAGGQPLGGQGSPKAPGTQARSMSSEATLRRRSSTAPPTSGSASAG